MTTRLLLLLAFIASACGDSTDESNGPETDPSRKVVYYKSPMDPSFIATKPGKDSMGMDLIPVYEGDPAANLDTIQLSGAVIQQSGVRVDKVRRGYLTRIVRALGRAQVDEARLSSINMKFDGWIEKLWVDQTGQKVKRWAPLFAVYSPELVASQLEYLQVLKSGAVGPHTAHLKRAARQRLLQFDVPRSFVRRLERTGKPQRRVVFSAPRGGYVIHKNALQGTFVKKGANLFTIGDLKAVWVIAEVYEFDAPFVAVGQKATVELDFLPGVMQEAKVDYIYPILDEKTRTIKVRFVLANPKILLKPGMFATVRIHTKPSGETLLVPDEAVIHSGERSVAFVSLGKGRFEPRELTLGMRGSDAYQVMKGLKEGELVVTSGQFLLDSESRLKEAVKKMLGSNVAKAHSKTKPSTDGAAKKDHAGESH